MWIAFGVGLIVGAAAGFLFGVMTAAASIANSRAHLALKEIELVRLRNERNLLLGVQHERN